MTNAQTEARAIVEEYEKRPKTSILINLITTALAAKDAELAEVKRALAERAGGVKVRALEWVDGEAKTPFGSSYTVHRRADGMYEAVGCGAFVNGPHPDRVSAKEAAQADYERRTLSALTTEPAAPEGQQPVALTYGQKLIAEAIEHHFGERGENYDEYEGDTTVDDVWAAFDDLTRPAEQAVTEAMVERLAQHLALDHIAIDDRAEYSWDAANEQWRQSWRRKARAALKAAMEAGR